MTNFVLVHGAFTGGWCWRDCRKALTVAGHNVFSPTLTGLGERHHLASPNLTIATHVDDIAAVITTEELENVVLVGHSSSGVIAAAVADRLHHHIAHLVFLDSSIPRVDGFEMALPPIARQNMINDFMSAPPPLAMQGVPDDHPAAAWYGRRRTPMPTGVAEGAVTLTGAWRKVRTTYVACTGGVINPHAAAAMEKAKDFGIPVAEIKATHAAMATAPEALAELLINLASHA